MRRFRLYFLSVCLAAALLGGCTFTSTEQTAGKASSGEADTEEAEDKTGAEGGTDTEEKAGESGEESQSAPDDPAASGKEDAAEPEVSGSGEDGENIIIPEVAEGHVISAVSEEETEQVVNINFERIVQDNMVHAIITGINGYDEVVWQNVTPEFEADEYAPLTGLTILADSYFYMENGAVVRINKENGVEYWRNEDFGGKITDLGWAQLGETFYFTGIEGPELFIMSMHGQTISVEDRINELFSEPYRLRLEGGRIILNYRKSPTGNPAIISVDPEDYSYAVIVDAEDVPTITDTTIYFANVETSLALRAGPGKDYGNISGLEPEEEMYLLKVVDDYAYVWARETGMVGYATGRYVVVDDGTYRSALDIAAEAAESPDETAEGAAESPDGAAEGAAESPDGAAEGAAESSDETAEGAAESPDGTAEDAAETTESEAESTAESAEAEAGSPAEAAQEDGETWYVDVETSLYLREYPDYDSDYITSLEPLTELIVLGYEDGLAHVRVKATGEEGYVAPKFITDDLNDLNYADH